MRDDKDGRKQLSVEVYKRFHAMKTYGKEPESLDSIIEIFTTDLENYPIEKIMKAIKTHSQRSQEFPTVSDLVGLIKRNGKQPLTKEIYISISKMDAEYRTSSDWAYMREYEAQNQEDDWGSDFIDKKSSQEKADDIMDLKIKNHDLTEENKRLAKLLRESQLSNGIEMPISSQDDKILKTIDMMRNSGAPENDIQEFIKATAA